jgi:hypothetical protein
VALLAISTTAALGDALSAPPAKAPSVKGVEPDEGPTSGGTEVVVSGKDLPSCVFSLTKPTCPSLIVYFGTEPGLVFSSSKKEVQVFAPSQPAAGQLDVTVVTPAGTSKIKKKDRFTYAGPPAKVVPGEVPVVTTVDPHHGSQAGFNEVRIQGEHLTPRDGVCVECNGDVVHFGTQNVAVSQGSPTELLVIAPPHAPGTVDVTVSTNPGGTSAMSEADDYTYQCLKHRGRGTASRRCSRHRG